MTSSVVVCYESAADCLSVLSSWPEAGISDLDLPKTMVMPMRELFLMSSTCSLRHNYYASLEVWPRSIVGMHAIA